MLFLWMLPLEKNNNNNNKIPGPKDTCTRSLWKVTMLVCAIRGNTYKISLAWKNVTTFSFFLIITIKPQKSFPKYWCKCWSQEQTTFVRVLFLRHCTICWDEGSTVLAWTVTESLHSCEVLLLGEFIGTRSWVADERFAALGGFAEEWPPSLCWLFSPDVDECLLFPSSSLMEGSTRKSSNFLKLQRYPCSFGSIECVLDWEYFK